MSNAAFVNSFASPGPHLAHFVLQLLERQLAIPPDVVPLPEDGGLAPASRFHVPVDSVVGDVGLAALEPLQVRDRDEDKKRNILCDPYRGSCLSSPFAREPSLGGLCKAACIR